MEYLINSVVDHAKKDSERIRISGNRTCIFQNSKILVPRTIILNKKTFAFHPRPRKVDPKKKKSTVLFIEVAILSKFLARIKEQSSKTGKINRTKKSERFASAMNKTVEFAGFLDI